MRAVFTRDHVSPGQAQVLIYSAAIVSGAYGLTTLFAVVRQIPGVSRYQFLDAGILLAVAVGIALRRAWAGWVGLVYFTVDAAVKILRFGRIDLGDTVLKLAIFAIAIVYIGLYPRRRPPASVAANPSTAASPAKNGDHDAA